jgi:phosphoglycolate phosphatase-like HAD superfamily hydrolase
MTISLPSTPYASVIFDCDGVILNSNRIKTQAFHDVAMRFGERAARLLLNFHVQHGGISRYRKFEYLLEEILGRPSAAEELAELAADYGDRVYQHLLRCEVSPGLTAMRRRMPGTRWAVVSGGDQEELRRVFAERNLSSIFDGGIYGSPRTKDEILQHQFQTGQLTTPAIFLGDSQYDHEAAIRAGLDFVFISSWSEFARWPSYCMANGVTVVESLEDALSWVLAAPITLSVKPT